MEILILILVVLVWIFGFSGLFRGAKNITTASVKTFTEGGNILGNLKEEFREMGAFEVQVTKTKIKIGEGLEDAYEVRVRGLLCAPRSSDLSFVVSLFDYTNKEFDFVISSLDFQQEKTTTIFQYVCDAGSISSNQGYKNWVKVATFYPDTLTASMKGSRIIKVFVRAMPASEIPKIEYGLHKEGAEIFTTASKDENIYFIEKGYVEARRERQEAKEIIVKIAVAIANYEDEMSTAEGRVIQSWVREQIESVSTSDKEEIKDKLNEALKSSFLKVSSGGLAIDELVSKLAALGLPSLNKSLIELLINVAGANEAMSTALMTKVRGIGSQLNIDYEDIKAMSDKAFLESSNIQHSEDSLEGILGIDPDWSKDQVLSHLRTEFAKWNGRIQSLEDEDEKKKAQAMLEAIAAARKKYGAN